jgi:hypothetical protein
MAPISRLERTERIAELAAALDRAEESSGYRLDRLLDKLSGGNGGNGGKAGTAGKPGTSR